LFHRLGDREVVECLSADTGEPIWSFDYPTEYLDDFGFDNGPRSVPTIADGRVYTFGAEGVLHCLDLASGEKLWSVDAHKRFGVRKGFFGAACSPVVEGDLVLLNIGGRQGAGVAAFHKETGDVAWTATNDEASYSSPVMADVDGTRHALFFTRAGLVDADPASGEVRFQFPWRPPISASVNAATPLVVGSRVFLSTSYGKGAVLLDVHGGKPKPVWASDDALTNHYATSVHRDGYLYGFHGRQEYGPSLRCVELATGRVKWSQDRFGAGTLIVAGDRLVVMHEDGRLLLASASPEGYRELAQAKILPGTVRAYPALAHGRLYARNASTLVCVDLARKREGE
jgi:outer membrane protein assembly factor BamB